jgi:uncharacterized alkaline shock family protein YloU
VGAGATAPAKRGATVIPDKVVARIAARAAHEALTRQAGPPSGRPVAAPSASAAVHEGSARLAVSLDLPYPVDIPRASRQIQHDIAERVAHLTGMNVSEVALTVRRLVPAEGLERRRVR